MVSARLFSAYILSVAGCITGRIIINNNKEKERELYAQNMLPITDDVYKKIEGRYVQSDGSYIEIASTAEMRMSTAANSGTEPITMIIHGYRNSDDGYYIYVKKSEENITYAYRKNGKGEYLYEGYDSKWNQEKEEQKIGKGYYVKEERKTEELDHPTDSSNDDITDDTTNQDSTSESELNEVADSNQGITINDNQTDNDSTNALDYLSGHYQDDYGDTVDIDVSKGTITRFIKGGHEDHIYDESIWGFEEVGDCYLIKVGWDNERYTYLYTNDQGEQRLYLGTDDGWEPSLSPYHYVTAQLYVKTTNPSYSNSSHSNNANEYILIDSDKMYYDRATLEDMSAEELGLARNEIYARHGRMFKAGYLQNYFNSKSWYRPLYSPTEFDAMGRSVFNDYENANLDLIIEIEKAKK